MDAELLFLIVCGAVIVAIALTHWVRVLVAEARASRKAVGWMRNRTRLRCLSVLQIMLAMLLFPIAFFVGNWSAAQTPSEVREKLGITVPERWRAVLTSGRTPIEWPYGTIRDNPAGFAFWAGLLVIILVVLLLSAIYAGRLRALDSGERSAEPSDPPDT
ncbi:MAG TPA: hypothetical protein VNE39_11490 [Planctomycetota bacterium]|nr:hypothetical protein [Planctomycetota bacterium]